MFTFFNPAASKGFDLLSFLQYILTLFVIHGDDRKPRGDSSYFFDSIVGEPVKSSAEGYGLIGLWPPLDSDENSKVLGFRRFLRLLFGLRGGESGGAP